MTPLIPTGFVIERYYPGVTPARVFACFADPKQKLAWMACHSNWRHDVFEFREGGREIGGDPTSSPAYVFDGVFQQIIPDRRIMYAYKMTRDGVLFATSITALDFEAQAGGTRFTFTEQSLFTDGPDTPALREEGTNWAVDQLRAYLESQRTPA